MARKRRLHGATPMYNGLAMPGWVEIQRDDSPDEAPDNFVNPYKDDWAAARAVAAQSGGYVGTVMLHWRVPGYQYPGEQYDENPGFDIFEPWDHTSDLPDDPRWRKGWRLVALLVTAAAAHRAGLIDDKGLKDALYEW